MSPIRLVIMLSAVTISGCQLSTVQSPTAPSSLPAQSIGPRIETRSGAARSSADVGSLAVNFPPRNEPFDFRSQLEVKYRDSLRRTAGSTFVDLEGDIVWIQEYLRYRVNRCAHRDAVDKVFAQLDGRGVQPICAEAPAGQVEFPPRNEPLAFRQELETKYRDGLRRVAVSSFVDLEGDIVWIQEYLRYRVNGCNHAEATQRVFDQIDGRGIQPVCVADVNLTGTWAGSGSDSSGPGQLTWRVTQNGTNFSGSLAVVDTPTGLRGSGTVSGSIAGATLRFTMSLPAGSFPAPYSRCSVQSSGAATFTNSRIDGTYTGVNSCTGSFTNGRITLTRQ